LIKRYRHAIALSQHCCAIANIGNTWKACWEALLAGKSIFSQGDKIIPGWPDSPPLSAILNFPGMSGQPSFIQRTDVLARIVGQEMRTAIDHFFSAHPSARVSLIVATSHGNPGPLSAIADAYVMSDDVSTIDAPTWSGIVTDNLVREVNAGLERELPGITISAACASSLVATSYAADRINTDICDAVLVVGIDTLSRVASVGFNNIGAMSQKGCRPYDQKRDGTTVGEGAIAMFLAKDSMLAPQDRWGLIAGTSIFCDAAHIVEPNPSGIASVVQSALQQASIKSADIRGIFWHGTGTRQNDKTEAAVSKILFGNKSPLSTSTKGSLGHTMGASGGFNVLAACEAMRQKVIPHVVGTSNPEYDNLNLVLDHPQSITPGPMLITALGFGGINAAVVVVPPEDL